MEVASIAPPISSIVEVKVKHESISLVSSTATSSHYSTSTSAMVPGKSLCTDKSVRTMNEFLPVVRIEDIYSPCDPNQTSSNTNKFIGAESLSRGKSDRVQMDEIRAKTSFAIKKQQAQYTNAMKKNKNSELLSKNECEDITMEQLALHFETSDARALLASSQDSSQFDVIKSSSSIVNKSQDHGGITNQSILPNVTIKSSLLDGLLRHKRRLPADAEMSNIGLDNILSIAGGNIRLSTTNQELRKIFLNALAKDVVCARKFRHVKSETLKGVAFAESSSSRAQSQEAQPKEPYLFERPNQHKDLYESMTNCSPNQYVGHWSERYEDNGVDVFCFSLDFDLKGLPMNAIQVRDLVSCMTLAFNKHFMKKNHWCIFSAPAFTIVEDAHKIKTTSASNTTPTAPTTPTTSSIKSLTKDVVKTALHLVFLFSPIKRPFAHAMIGYLLAAARDHFGDNFPFGSEQGLQLILDPGILVNGLRFNLQNKAILCPNRTYNFQLLRGSGKDASTNNPCAGVRCTICHGTGKLDAGRPYRVIGICNPKGQCVDRLPVLNMPNEKGEMSAVTFSLKDIQNIPFLELALTSMYPYECIGRPTKERSDWYPNQALAASLIPKLSVDFLDIEGNVLHTSKDWDGHVSKRQRVPVRRISKNNKSTSTPSSSSNKLLRLTDETEVDKTEDTDIEESATTTDLNSETKSKAKAKAKANLETHTHKSKLTFYEIENKNRNDDVGLHDNSSMPIEQMSKENLLLKAKKQLTSMKSANDSLSSDELDDNKIAALDGFQYSYVTEKKLQEIQRKTVARVVRHDQFSAEMTRGRKKVVMTPLSSLDPRFQTIGKINRKYLDHAFKNKITGFQTEKTLVCELKQSTSLDILSFSLDSKICILKRGCHVGAPTAFYLNSKSLWIRQQCRSSHKYANDMTCSDQTGLAAVVTFKRTRNARLKAIYAKKQTAILMSNSRNSSSDEQKEHKEQERKTEILDTELLNHSQDEDWDPSCIVRISTDLHQILFKNVIGYKKLLVNQNYMGKGRSTTVSTTEKGIVDASGKKGTLATSATLGMSGMSTSAILAGSVASSQPSSKSVSIQRSTSNIPIPKQVFISLKSPAAAAAGRTITGPAAVPLTVATTPISQISQMSHTSSTLPKTTNLSTLMKHQDTDPLMTFSEYSSTLSMNRTSSGLVRHSRPVRSSQAVAPSVPPLSNLSGGSGVLFSVVPPLPPVKGASETIQSSSSPSTLSNATPSNKKGPVFGTRRTVVETTTTTTTDEADDPTTMMASASSSATSAGVSSPMSSLSSSSLDISTSTPGSNTLPSSFSYIGNSGVLNSLQEEGKPSSSSSLANGSYDTIAPQPLIEVKLQPIQPRIILRELCNENQILEDTKARWGPIFETQCSSALILEIYLSIQTKYLEIAQRQKRKVRPTDQTCIERSIVLLRAFAQDYTLDTATVQFRSVSGAAPTDEDVAKLVKGKVVEDLEQFIDIFTKVNAGDVYKFVKEGSGCSSCFG